MDLKHIKRAVLEQGGTWEVTKRGHITVRDSQGRRVATKAGSSGYPRALANFVADLRRGGFEIRRK